MENKSSENELPASQAISLTMTFCFISAVFIYLIYSNNIVFGSKVGGWIYPYFKNTDPISLWIPLTVLFLAGVFIYVGDKLIKKYEKATLLGCFLIAVVIQILIQSLYHFPMGQLIKSDGTNSFYTPALQHSPAEILSQYQLLAPSFPLHARTNMPGKILFFQFLTIFTTSPQIMGYLIISISTLGGLILYGICKHLFDDKTLALYAFVLYTLIPGKQVFFPILNTVTPIFILICMYFLVVYLDSKNRLFLVLLGLSLYSLALFEPSPFITGILFIGVLLHAFVQKKILVKELIGILLIPILSAVITHLFFLVFFSFNLWTAGQYVVKDAMEFNLSAQRGYSIWLRENVKEFFYAVGLPILMIFIYFLNSIFSQWKILVKNIANWCAIHIYVVGLLLTFCIVLFLGVNRGETTRLWIYLAVFFQVPAAYFMAKSVKSNTMFFMLAGVLILQSIISVLKVGFIVP